MKRYTRAGSNIDSDISRYKKALERKAAKSGLYENFGQDEIRKLREKYRELPDDTIDYRTAERNRNSISSFEDWCMNYVGACDRVMGSTDIPDVVYCIYFGDSDVDLDPSLDNQIARLKAMIDKEIANGNADDIDFAECQVTSVPTFVDAYGDMNCDWDDEEVEYCADTDDDYSDYVSACGDVTGSTKYGADMCSIGASVDEDGKFYVAGYLGDNYRGLMSDLYSDDFEEILSVAADMSAQGLFIEITNRADGRRERYTPEDFEIAAENGEYPDHIQEDLAL